jgi:DNA-binding MarR family transcriptional regulator
MVRKNPHKNARTAARAVPETGEGMRGERGHLPYLLAQANAAVRLALDRAFADLNVTVPQFSVLTMIDAYPGVSGAELARLTLLTPQTINVIVKNLERDGLIAKTPDEVHGRVLRIATTAKGHQFRLKCRARADRMEKLLVDGLSDAEQRTIRRWLVIMTRSLQEQRTAEEKG